MLVLKKIREKRGVSQRQLAQMASLSYKTVQLMESVSHDPKLSSLDRLATAMGYPTKYVSYYLQSIFLLEPDSVFVTTFFISKDPDQWKIYLFNFVDAFRLRPKSTLINEAPMRKTAIKWKNLLAATVETLCEEQGVLKPEWCSAIESLGQPWFVTEIENLKATALIESPIHFRKRNIFVLNNFLTRK